MSIHQNFVVLSSTLFLLALPTNAKATVMEFSDDGTITKFEATDYLSQHRHFRFAKASFPKHYKDLVSKYSSQYGVNADLVHAVGQPPF